MRRGTRRPRRRSLRRSRPSMQTSRGPPRPSRQRRGRARARAARERPSRRRWRVPRRPRQRRRARGFEERRLEDLGFERRCRSRSCADGQLRQERRADICADAASAAHRRTGSRAPAAVNPSREDARGERTRTEIEQEARIRRAERRGAPVRPRWARFEPVFSVPRSVIGSSSIQGDILSAAT